MKNDLTGKTVVITQIRLHDYAGSEIVTLEMASFFSECGAKVIVATHTTGEPILDDFKQLKNTRVIESDQKNFDLLLKEANPDIVWVHHQYVPEALLDNKKALFIYHHMSPFVELESPLFWRLEQSLADVILFNSQECMNEYFDRGYFNDRHDRTLVLNNPAPLSFFDTQQKHLNKTPTKALIVSNHPPDEIVKAMKIMNSRGIEVVMFGAVLDGKVSRVLPEHIQAVDVVISIGKTVQYSLAMGVPVYCYDHFGGPGYLSAKNYEKAKQKNFSGRGFKKKDASKIADEVILNYNKARKFTKEIRPDVDKEFRIDTKIIEVLKIAKRTKELSVKPDISALDIDSYINNMRIIQRNVRGVADRESSVIQAMRNQINELQNINKSLLLHIDKLEYDINILRNSRAYKVGKAAIYPISKIKRIAKTKKR